MPFGGPALGVNGQRQAITELLSWVVAGRAGTSARFRKPRFEEQDMPELLFCLRIGITRGERDLAGARETLARRRLRATR